MLAKKRYNNLSLYRIVAAILVLQFHIFFVCYPESIPGSIYLSKFVQGLTALSGFLLSQKVIYDVKSFYSDKFRRSLIPALLIILSITIWNFIWMFISKDYNFFNHFVGYRAYNGRLLIQFGNYYYIFYILFCYLITPLLQKSKIGGIFIFIIVALVETSVSRWIEPLYIVSAYILGYYIGKFTFNSFIGKYRWTDLIHFAICITATALTIVYSIILSSMTHTRIILIGVNALYALFGVFSMLTFLMLFKFFNNLPEIRIDKLSYTFFLFNQIFMVGATDITKVLNSPFEMNVVVLLFVTVFSIIFYYIYKRIDIQYSLKKKKKIIVTNSDIKLRNRKIVVESK